MSSVEQTRGRFLLPSLPQASAALLALQLPLPPAAPVALLGEGGAAEEEAVPRGEGVAAWE